MEKDTPGYTRGKGEEKHGIRASNTSPLTFDNAFVPVENIIGGVLGQGLKQASKVFGYTRLMVAAMALGGGEAALEIAMRYAKERIQFKTPLSEKQGYTHKLIVPHAVRLAAAEAYIDEVGLTSGPRESRICRSKAPSPNILPPKRATLRPMMLCRLGRLWLYYRIRS